MKKLIVLVFTSLLFISFNSNLSVAASELSNSNITNNKVLIEQQVKAGPDVIYHTAPAVGFVQPYKYFEVSMYGERYRGWLTFHQGSNFVNVYRGNLYRVPLSYPVPSNLNSPM